MTDPWDQVRWTEARQLTELMRLPDERWPAAEVSPQAHYTALRADGKRYEAIAFLGHALPRFEALAWACRILEQQASSATLRPRDRRALDHALRWLGEPNDARRRSAHEASEEASNGSAEQLLGMAVFMSGGSISLPDLPAVLPPSHVAGSLAATAIVVAAGRAEKPNEVLDRALDLGERIAAKGAIILETA